MRNLFACWSEVAARVSSSPAIALFLDFDGTLAAIQPRPEMARVLPYDRPTLAALAHSPRFRVWVISARRRDDLRERVGVPALRYLGLYGWEGGAPLPPRSSPIRQVKQILAATLPAHPSVWIEDKQYTVATHYRGAPESIRCIAEERLRRAVEPFNGELRIAPGKCVWEVIPRTVADKGTAVRREISALRDRVLPIYVGDDLSDESAFAALPRVVGIRVGGEGRTRARYRLRGPDEVHQFLLKLKKEFV